MGDVQGYRDHAPRPLLVAIAALTAVFVTGCGRPAEPLLSTWSPVKGLGYVVSAQAPTVDTPWLLGGDTVGGDGVTHVAAWSAARATGPWQPVGLVPVPGRDGPNETILGFAAPVGLGPIVMFGSRRSPTEGYPRPSTWTAVIGQPLLFYEVLADRELFGGPNVVSIGTKSGGGLTSGPHGFHIAGTWVGPADAAVASVWGASAAGQPWSRDTTDPAFVAGPGQQAYGADVADGSAGLLMVGYLAAPTTADPLAQYGALWYSADGRAWTRLGLLPSAALSAVRVSKGGWTAGGSRGSRPAVWRIGTDLAASLTVLPGTGTVTDLAVDGAAVWAAGVSADGSAELWRGWVPTGRWSAVPVPPAGGVAWDQARLAVGRDQLLLVMFNGTVSAVWRTTVLGDFIPG